MPDTLKQGVTLSAYAWASEAKGILRAELSRRNVTYAQLAKLMLASDIQETPRSLANKISRGSFSFVFFLQAMRVLGVKTVSLEPIEKKPGAPVLGQPEALGRGKPAS